jgi:hypothetical protein
MSTLLDSIRRVFGEEAAPRTRYTRDVTFILTATVPANSPAGTRATINFQEDPSQAAVSVFQIPLDRSLVIEDIYVTATQGVDGVLLIHKNGDRLVSQTPPINSMLVSNPSRARVQPFVLNSGDRLSALYVTMAATGASAVNITVIAKGRYIVG